MGTHLRQYASPWSSCQEARLQAGSALRKGHGAVHSFARHAHRRHLSGERPAGSTTNESKRTNGLILGGGWRYDLHVWLIDTFAFRGQGRQLRLRTLALARLQPGERVLDVGCGTGTLALAVGRRVGGAGRVVAIDPSTEQIERARTKAARRHACVEFQVGVIERLAFPDRSFDVVLSTLMMHHLPAGLKRQGLAEIARVLKPGGRLVIADFTRKQERVGRAARFHAGGSSLQDLVAFVKEAGFSQVETEELPPPRFSAFPGAGLVLAYKRSDEGAIKEREG
jgi:ubiquinone/menaquinone biosynthesis C-methylase UbiE